VILSYTVSEKNVTLSFLQIIDITGFPPSPE